MGAALLLGWLVIVGFAGAGAAHVGGMPLVFVVALLCGFVALNAAKAISESAS